MGRVERPDRMHLRMGYPGVTLRVRFEGPEILLRASSTTGDSRLDVSVDGAAPTVVRVAQEEGDLVLTSGLPAGPHTVDVVHRTEAWQGIVTVRGFVLPRGGRTLAPQPWPSRRLLFIGDSVTCGERVERPATCGPKDAARDSNGFLSYGMIAARALDAQAHLVCYGGRGLVRDWEGKRDVLNAPQFFRLSVADAEHLPAWSHAAYAPDAVVVSLGTNDFNLSQGALPERAGWVSAYVRFVKDIRAAHPQALILLTEGAIVNDATDPQRPTRTVLREYIRETVRRVGDPRVRAFESQHYPGDDCDAHPTRAQHEAMARDLEPVLREALSGAAPAGEAAAGEDGYDLWLRYRPVGKEGLRASYAAAAGAIVVQGRSAPERALAAELARGLSGLLERKVAETAAVDADGAVVAGTPATSPLVAALGWDGELRALGPEGYILRRATVGGHRALVIASEGPVGALYGAFAFLRHLQLGRPLDALDLSSRPRLKLRLLDHWDNLDGSVERGYAGQSLWNWSALPGRVDPRLTDYARANASLGINGSVLNNVNANPLVLTPEGLAKAAAVADVLRPYGIRVYLSASFAAPKTIGGLGTADPLDPAVAKWWRDTADAAWRAIPDFGGFLVKANSEGQPGPQDYGRTHVDGANVLADAVKPHGGVVMYRAFVYNPDVDPDRVKRAYLEFQPLDGRFRDNVLVQVKNGPLDFQPREPFHPLFGAMPKTPLMAELQVTQEYLGHSTHLVYLAPMWKEFLGSDTHAPGAPSTVEKVVDGTLEGHTLTGMAGVANTGSDRNWCGHDFAQANWYAYGRLAWDPALDAGAIAEEWIVATWGADRDVVATLLPLMMGSRETFVSYTMPLGLHHLIGGNHYAPMPENDKAPRVDWTATYYHRADARGVGFDRTRTGSGGVDQYRPPLNDVFGDPARVPEDLLLWFHHVPWDHKMKSGRTLWDELVSRYGQGAEQARQMEAQWRALGAKIDPGRHAAVAARLAVQSREAAEWGLKCLRYFQAFSGRPIPEAMAGAAKGE